MEVHPKVVVLVPVPAGTGTKAEYTVWVPLALTALAVRTAAFRWYSGGMRTGMISNFLGEERG